MTKSISDIVVDVDLRNPGQFFACCGILELSSRLWPDSEGWFVVDRNYASFQILIHSEHNDPLGEIVRRLCETPLLAVIAQDEAVDQLQADRQPVILEPFEMRLDWWLDSYGGSNKSELKVWAGQQTPARNFNGLQEAWRKILARAPGVAGTRKIFHQHWPTFGRFGFDPAASWAPLDIGFSPDEQGVPVLTSPSTEILAAIGLQRCRPTVAEGKRRWFAYRAWQHPLDIIVVPAAVVGAGQGPSGYEFPVVMRNAQYGSFGWAKPLEVEQ